MGNRIAALFVLANPILGERQVSKQFARFGEVSQESIGWRLLETLPTNAPRAEFFRKSVQLGGFAEYDRRTR